MANPVCQSVKKNLWPVDKLNFVQANDSIAHNVRPHSISTWGSGDRIPAKKNADPDREGHSTKCDQADNKISKFGAQKVRGNSSKIKKNAYPLKQL